MILNNKIFVYGTLMDGLIQEVLPGIERYVKRKKKGKINARLFDLGEYPAARRTRLPNKVVYGLLYELDPKQVENVLDKMDDYEEYDPKKKNNSLYIRKLTPVIMESGGLDKAWVYWYNKPVNAGDEIKTGDYKKYLRQNKSKINGIK